MYEKTKILGIAMPRVNTAVLIDLTGRSALVTGGGDGLGRNIVETLASAGASVMIMDVRPENALTLKKELNAEGCAVEFVQGDVSKAADAAQAVEATRQAFGSIDILVNNAAVFDMVPTVNMSEEAWDRLINVNLKGTHLMCQAAIRAMLEQGERSYYIVNISSAGGLIPTVPNAVQSHYYAAKAGVINYTRALGKEYMASGIRVNGVAPGGMAGTPGSKSLRPNISPEQAKAMMEWGPRTPAVLPEEVARMVLALAGPMADGMRGETVLVDAGLNLQLGGYPLQS